MNIYLVRHPIFNRMEEVVGYEILFRDGLGGIVGALSPDQAASRVADALNILGIDEVSGEKMAYVPLTRNLLLQDVATFLPNGRVAIELLEEMAPDPEVLDACKRLKEAGYPLVLGESALLPQQAPLLALADILKINGTGAAKEDKTIRARLPRGAQLLTARLERRADFEEAMAVGGQLFQGNFFSKPVLVTGKEIPGFKLNYVRLLKETQRADMDFDRVEKILKMEMSLAYKLLRYINSAYFSFSTEIQSIRHALMMLGENAFKKWVSFAALAGLAQDKPNELVFQATLRGRFLELLAEPLRLGHRTDDLFLMGMFSLIDALVDRPMADVLKEMPIAQDVKSTLLGEESPLRDPYRLCLSYLEANWTEFEALAKKIGIEEAVVPERYMTALTWTSQHFQGIPAQA